MFLERIKANADLFVRVPLGVIMFAHGSQKTLGLFGGGGFSKTIEGFEQNLGIPPVFTVLAMAAEFLGGICVLLGLLTRLSAFGIACTYNSMKLIDKKDNFTLRVGQFFEQGFKAVFKLTTVFCSGDKDS